jgi:hypothetical protein
MPDFIGLTQHVIEFFDPPAESDVMAAFQPWLDNPFGANAPLDQIFNLLHQEYGKDEVNALVTERLRISAEVEGIGREHALIKRISSGQDGVPQVVTTNFDRLFEVDDGTMTFHVPPSFPDLNFGTTIEGVTYLHGRLADAGSLHHPYVLSSADFGRAYLSEGWATKFIRGLLERYTVVLLGYKAEDPPVKYLLQGLNHDGKYDSSRLYAFDRGEPEDVEVKWRDRGVTAIAYSEHVDLWRAMEAWAERADDPRQWRAAVIASSQSDPKGLSAFERGQVAHVLRRAQGSRLFSELDPAPHPEWICVLDANVRGAKQSRGYEDNSETFDPSFAYGLDDLRQGGGNDNLLAWHDGDDNPHDFHHLFGRQTEGFEVVPARLGHIITWISKSIESPVIAWWAIRTNGLHSRVLQQIEWEVQGSSSLNKRARHVLGLILEQHSDPRNRCRGSDWYDFKKRVVVEGWTPGVLRDLRSIVRPRVIITPPRGLASSKPPSKGWEDICLSSLGAFEVKFLERFNEDLEVPDEVLPEVFGILVDQLNVASGLLDDVDTVYFRTPTCYPDREVEGKQYVDDAAEVITLVLQLFDRLADIRPDLAHGHVAIWPQTEKYFFRKLKLYAFSKKHLFEPCYVVESVLSFDQKAFWDRDVVRELLFLFIDRWEDFSPENRNRLIERILAGPNQLSHWTDEEYPNLRDEFAARYGRCLELKGCLFSPDLSSRLAIIISRIPRWSDGWAASMVTEHGSYGGYISTDENPDVLLELPVDEVIVRAENDLGTDFKNLTERRPFRGLVKTNPRKALSALTLAGKCGKYPKDFWSSLIDDLPEGVPVRLMRVFLHRLSRLPYEVVVELRHTLGRWLEQNLVSVLDFDEDLGWAVYDHIVEGILSGGVDASKIGLGEILRAGEVVEQSRRTYSHAINSPLGKCVEVLFHAVPGEIQEAGSLIPEHIKSRVELLLEASGGRADYAIAITMRMLNWLMHVDPAWTRERLVLMLEFDHPSSEPAWNGFLNGPNPPSRSLAELVKGLMVDLFPWIYSFSWGLDRSDVAVQWLGFLYVFHRSDPDGLNKREMRTVLRSVTDESRNRFIFWLGRVGAKNENGWRELIVPFINEVWPRERRYCGSGSVRAWVVLLAEAKDCFPTVYMAVKKFLVPVEMNEHSFYRFTRELNDGVPITARFPEEVLDLMDTVTPRVLATPPYELSKVLVVIAEARLELTSDPRYLRLIDLVERS